MCKMSAVLDFYRLRFVRNKFNVSNRCVGRHVRSLQYRPTKLKFHTKVFGTLITYLHNELKLDY
jgi:hypothetical protein